MIDFFTVPTAPFRMLFAFVAMRHNRRYVVHLIMTAHLTAALALPSRLLRCFPRTQRCVLIRDRGGIYGNTFQQRFTKRKVVIKLLLAGHCASRAAQR